MIYTCIFGKPHGMQHRLFDEHGLEVRNSRLEGPLLLLPWNEPKDPELVFRVRRWLTKGQVNTWFGIYSEAAEMSDNDGPTRPGYIGVGLLAENEQIDGDISAFLFSYLKTFAQDALVKRRFVKLLRDVRVAPPLLNFERKPVSPHTLPDAAPANSLFIDVTGCTPAQTNDSLIDAQAAMGKLANDIFISASPRIAADSGKSLTYAGFGKALAEPTIVLPDPAREPPSALHQNPIYSPRPPYPPAGSPDPRGWNFFGLFDRHGSAHMDQPPKIILSPGGGWLVALVLLFATQNAALWGMMRYSQPPASATKPDPGAAATSDGSEDTGGDIRTDPQIAFQGISCEQLADGKFRVKSGGSALTLSPEARETVGVMIGGRLHPLCQPANDRITGY